MKLIASNLLTVVLVSICSITNAQVQPAELDKAAGGDEEAAEAISSAANAMEDIALGLKTTVDHIANEAEEKKKLQKVVIKDIGKENAELKKIQNAEKAVEAHGPPQPASEPPTFEVQHNAPAPAIAALQQLPPRLRFHRRKAAAAVEQTFVFRH